MLTRSLCHCLSQQRLARAVEAVRYVATRAQDIHCTVAIYAHGGWMGEPDNELKVLEKLAMPNVRYRV